MNDLLVYVGIGLLVIVIGLCIWVALLSRRITHLCRDKQGSSLEKIITSNNQDLVHIKELQNKQHEDINELQEQIQNSLQNINVVRFNPYKDTGGNQSFAIAITDSHNNGVVLSSLYYRERVHVFAKPIENGSSSFPLTEEEQQALSSL
jgi:hypothetical protein